ncbi:LytTR family DNA-binding domain-containing protein [soil metagenome]
MRILILENELHAVERLEKLIKLVAPEKRVIGKCTSISETNQWLNENEYPDLVLSDVHLDDGLSFDIFRKLDKKLQVIFISAYDTYAIDAFKAEGLHYLLKPVDQHELKEAINRYDVNSSKKLPVQEHNMKVISKKYQERFIINAGNQIRLIYDVDIAYIFTENKAVFLVNFNNQKFLVDISLETFEKTLNPALFYRINRQVIVNLHAIHKMIPASKQRIGLTLVPSAAQETVTSFERTPNFKKWLLGDM